VVVLAGVGGLLAGIVYMLRPGGQGLKTRVPFGPFLSLGAMLYVLYGKAVLAWYLSLLA
jgi:leader peptidase (prepilin peptidase)/N-methyltransferase